MFKGIINFLTATFLRNAQPQVDQTEPNRHLSPVLRSGTQKVSDQIYDISVEEILLWPTVQKRKHVLNICEDIERYLIDSCMSVSVKESKGLLDLKIIVTSSGIQFGLYETETMTRRRTIDPIIIKASDPENDNALLLLKTKTFDEIKARGFSFIEEEPARNAFDLLSEMVNIEANRPAIMRRSAIIASPATPDFN